MDSDIKEAVPELAEAPEQNQELTENILGQDGESGTGEMANTVKCSSCGSIAVKHKEGPFWTCIRCMKVFYSKRKKTT